MGLLCSYQTLCWLHPKKYIEDNGDDQTVLAIDAGIVPCMPITVSIVIFVRCLYVSVYTSETLREIALRNYIIYRSDKRN